MNLKGSLVYAFAASPPAPEPRRPGFLLIDGEKGRRERALDFSGCKSRPGTGSLHPAIEAAAEATKLSELSM